MHRTTLCTFYQFGRDIYNGKDDCSLDSLSLDGSGHRGRHKQGIRPGGSLERCMVKEVCRAPCLE